MKRIPFLVILALSLVLFGCNTSDQSIGEAPEGTIIDANGISHEIPEDPEGEKIALVYGVATPFVVGLDLSDQMVGVNMKTKFWEEADPRLVGVPQVGRGQVDLEALAESGATVLIHRANDTETVDSVQEKLGIPVIAIDVETLDDIKYTFEMLGDYFGKEARADEVINWMDSKFSLVEERSQQIGAEDRVEAVVLGSSLGNVAGGDMLQSELLERAGAKSSAADVDNGRRWSEVGVETIFEWNPDFIFATASSVLEYRISDVMADPVWSEVTAVKNEDFYQIPAGYDSWDMPGVASPLASMYMLNKMYPEVLSTEELQEQIDEYYTFMFGRTFDADYLIYDLDE